MTPLEPALQAGLNTVVAELGLVVPPAQIDTLLRYHFLLQRWNSVYNLTSVRDPEQMLTLHVADCLALVAPLRRQLEGQSGAGRVAGHRASPGARLLDVGSGAGLPGVVIAALNPDMAVTCVETVGKKAAFVQQVASELALKNLRSEHTRVERLHAAPFNVITSRAFASLPDFVKLTRPLLAPQGAWMAMKGKHPADELAQLPADVDVFHVEPLAVPGLIAERCLVWMKDKASSAA